MPLTAAAGLCDEDCVLTGHQSAIKALVEGVGGKLLSGDDEGVVRVWEL